MRGLIEFAEREDVRAATARYLEYPAVQGIVVDYDPLWMNLWRLRCLIGERTLRAKLAMTRGLPKAIVCDNGPEFTSAVLDQWAYERGVHLDFIDPGKPVQNAFIESFNGTFRNECLNEHWFLTLADAQQIIADWRIDYETERPHSQLRDLTPREFALELSTTTTSQQFNPGPT